MIENKIVYCLYFKREFFPAFADLHLSNSDFFKIAIIRRSESHVYNNHLISKKELRLSRMTSMLNIFYTIVFYARDRDE